MTPEQGAPFDISRLPKPRPIEVRSAPNPPAHDRVVEASTEIGSIYLQRGAELVTPYILKHHRYAPDICALMRKALHSGMTFVDAGANIGWFSVLASKLVGPEGRVFAVEPDEFNGQVLHANLARHGCTNATILPLAAWNERTDLTIRQNPQGGAGVAVATGEEGLARIPSARLDELIDGRVDYLKVDCEMTDHLVVAGAEKLIRANPSILITVEFVPQHGSHTGDSPAEILAVYRELGLSPYRILKRRGLRPTSYDAVLRGGPPDRVTQFDFALSPALPERLLAAAGASERLERLLPQRFRPSERRKFLMWRKGLLERGGDLLDYVPERIRPKIRRRDRPSQSP
jgi:FkbM family methyltransferase